MAVRRIGDWQRARTLLGAAPGNLSRGMDIALRQEAELFRRKVIEGITSGAPGGKKFKPLKQTTLAMRKARRKSGGGGTKPLIDRGDLRRSITVKKATGGYFVGVLKGRTNRDGRQFVNIAATHEFGATITIRMTQKMRRFLAMMMKRGGLGEPAGASGPVIVVKIPPRPFLQPVADKLRPQIAQRVLDRIGKTVLGV